MDIVSYVTKYVDGTVALFVILFVISFLITLYSIAILNKHIRLMHESLKQITEDNKLLNESLRLVQEQFKGGAPTATPPAPIPPAGDGADSGSGS